MPLVRKPAKPSGPTGSGSLTSANVDERWAAARAADDPSGLVAALRAESDVRIREAMFTSLTRIGTPEAARGMLVLLRSDDANLRTGALDALRLMVGAVRGLLPNLLKDADVDVRILSCELARSLPGEEATQLLCGLLATERDVNVCGAAIDVLAEVGDPSAIPTLTECAQRFRDAPFLAFAIEIATDRIHSQSARIRG